MRWSRPRWRSRMRWPPLRDFRLGSICSTPGVPTCARSCSRCPRSRLRRRRARGGARRPAGLHGDAARCRELRGSLRMDGGDLSRRRRAARGIGPPPAASPTKAASGRPSTATSRASRWSSAPSSRRATPRRGRHLLDIAASQFRPAGTIGWRATSRLDSDGVCERAAAAGSTAIRSCRSRTRWPRMTRPPWSLHPRGRRHRADRRRRFPDHQRRPRGSAAQTARATRC